MTAAAGEPERLLIQRLLDGDETAFTELFENYHGAMIRLARGFVHDRETAEEVAQEAWLGVLNGLASFRGNSSLKGWIFAIVANKAKTRGVREARSKPFSALAISEALRDERAVDPDRFLGPDSQWPGHWALPPTSWGDRPEERLLRTELVSKLLRILDGLPTGQATVLRLRDVEGFDARAVCNILGLSETNVRVLLHRARSKVRAALEAYLQP